MTTILATDPQGSGGEDAVTLDPSAGEALGTASDQSLERVDSALEIAAEAARGWRHTRLTDRQLIFGDFAVRLRAQRDDLAALLTSETGQPIRDSNREIDEAAAYFLEAIGESNAFYGRVYPHGAEAITASFLQYTVHEPLGVVAVVMDDESPVLSFAFQTASTLLAGNAVVVRVSPHAPLTLRKVAGLLYESDLPSDVLQVIAADGDVTAGLIASARLNGLNFHGTSEEAIRATEAARANLTRVVAMGGSNDAVIVFDDADLGAAAAEIVRAGLVNAGQGRTAPKRVLIQQSVRAAVTELLVAETEKFAVADPAAETTVLGTLVDEAAAQQVGSQISRAVDSGARLLVGGTVNTSAVSPTLLDLADADDPLARSEIIRGPVLAIVGFESDDDAYAIANSSPYGFGVGVFTSDFARAGAASTRLETSVVVINGAGDHRARRIPFGGVKKSGVGVESLLATPTATTEIKTILAADIYDFEAVNEQNMAGRHT